MTGFRNACLAAAVAAAAAGISTAASAQYVDPDYGGYGWTPSRDTACTQDRRDFAERTNFICR